MPPSMEDTWHLSPETTAVRTVITIRNDRSLLGRIGHSAVRSNTKREEPQELIDPTPVY